MGYIKKYSYLRAFFIGIPFGIACIVGGIKTFNELPEVGELIKVEGVISKIEPRVLREGERIYDFVEITLNNGKKYSSGEYKEDILNFFEKHKALNKVVKIWHENEHDNIRQLVYGDIMLIKYKPPYWIAHFFLWLGVITLAAALIYVIKHPEDLTGKKKK